MNLSYPAPPEETRQRIKELIEIGGQHSAGPGWVLAVDREETKTIAMLIASLSNLSPEKAALREAAAVLVHDRLTRQQLEMTERMTREQIEAARQVSKSAEELTRSLHIATMAVGIVGTVATIAGASIALLSFLGVPG